VPDKLLKQCSVLWTCADYDLPRVASCRVPRQLATWDGLCLVTWCVHLVTRHNTPIHNILLTAPQLSISQKALGMLPEDCNVMPKHVGATIHT
jgi:hypothetical protein